MSWRAEKPSVQDERVIGGPLSARPHRRVAMRIVPIVVALLAGMIGGCALYLLIQVL